MYITEAVTVGHYYKLQFNGMSWIWEVPVKFAEVDYVIS